MSVEVRIENLCKSYGELMIFERFSHAFPEGRISCVLGPSGRGKTTLLRLIAGLEAPDSGEIWGMEGRRAAMVFQEDRLFMSLSAERNVLLTARPGFTRADARALLEELGLEARSTPVREYSGGMRRRVAIARALAAEYEVLLLDEPFAGLDEGTRERAIQAIRKHSAGRTVICATHGQEDAAKLEAKTLKL